MSDDSNHRSGDGAAAGWIGGAVLILIGVAFLVRNLTGFELHNWWAFFILIPAVGAFNRAYHLYQSRGMLDREARGSLLSGLALTFIAGFFLLELSFGDFWPVLLILAGLGLLINALLPG